MGKACGTMVVPIAMVMVILSAQKMDGAVTCDAVEYGLLPCATFISGNAEKPTQGCCTGFKTLISLGRTTQDRQFICLCFKSAAGSIGMDIKKAFNLPTMCRLSLNLPINAFGNCSADL